MTQVWGASYCVIALVLAAAGCKRATSPLATEVVIEKYDILSPADLNIQKQRFKVTPRPDEVAIFRCKWESKTAPPMSLSLDQIYWANGKEIHEDVVIVPLSFYMGYPKEEASEPQFSDSWKVSAGNFLKDVNGYTFLRSGFSSSGAKAKGEIFYSKNLAAKSEDLILQFEMFVLSLEDAKKLHPQLDIDRETGTTSWKAVLFTP